MSGVFQNIDPPTRSPPGECVPPRLWCGGRTHSPGGEMGVGGGVNILEEARHSSVLYICKYFVIPRMKNHKMNASTKSFNVTEKCFLLGGSAFQPIAVHGSSACRNAAPIGQYRCKRKCYWSGAPTSQLRAVHSPGRQ
jgi:hypothetical protein